MEKPRPICERVREQVDAAGLSVADIARSTGWSEQKVYRLLTGKTELSAEQMEILARLIRKPVQALYRGRRAAS